MNLLNSLKKPAFLSWLARTILFSLIWVGFIWLSATYQNSKYPGDDGPIYYYLSGILATLPMLGLYIFADYKFKKRKWNEKSLWKLWLFVVSVALITSPIWVFIIMLLVFAGGIFLFIPTAVFFSAYLTLEKFKK